MKRGNLLAVLMLLVAFSTAIAAEQSPTFHGIKLGVSLGSQFQECPWNPPKEGDISEYIYSPYKDEKGNTVPCFHDARLFKPASYPQLESVELVEYPHRLKDDEGKVLPPQPRLTRYIQVLVPASTQLGEGTIEGAMLWYLPEELDEIKDALVAKFGTSHPPEKKMTPKMMELLAVKSREVWGTGWGEVFLVLTDKEVSVTARTSKLIAFEKENKKDEF